MSTDQRITRRKLSDEVFDRLLQSIEEGLLPPGSQLPSERELMAQYAVGRPAVREEYLIADGRLMLYREAPENLVAKFYRAAPHMARLKLKDFDTLWNESPGAQELRQLGI